MGELGQKFLQSGVDGLATGSLYAMIALGYTLVYGIIRLINFAHGEFYMVGAYAGFFVLTSPWAAQASPAMLGVWLALGLGASVGGASALAVLTERLAYRPIRRYDRIVALLTAIGVSFLLQNGARLVFRPEPRNFRVVGQTYPDSALVAFLDWYRAYSRVLGVELQNAKILIMVVAALSMAGLYFLVMKTRLGKAMRATSQDLEAARLMGIDVDRVIAQAFALGGAFAGLAGLLIGMLRNVEPMMGFMPGLKAFVAAVVGGIGSIPGAVVGGLVIGLVENLAIFFNLDSAYKDAVAFGLLVVILLVRPGGILGVQRREKV